MGVWVVVLMGCCILAGELMAVTDVDFAVKDIRVETDGFIHILLENKTNIEVKLTPELLEKVFLIIYINNVKRAEYKVKYMATTLFKKQGDTLFRTNFRVPNALEVAVEINLLKVFPETNFSNNRLLKMVQAQAQ